MPEDSESLLQTLVLEGLDKLDSTLVIFYVWPIQSHEMEEEEVDICFPVFKDETNNYIYYDILKHYVVHMLVV